MRITTYRPSGWIARSGVAIAVTLGTAACGSTSDAEEQQQAELAQQLVVATQEAGVAPRLTAELAADLYGTEAPVVCDVFEGGLGAAGHVMLGNLAHGRRKAISDQALTYARIVVETYCPEVLDDFDDAVADVEPMEVDQ